LFWSCVNDELRDNNGAYRTFFYTRYAFTLLGGPEKTQKWLADHEEIIRLVYEEAKANVEKAEAKDKAKKKNSEISHEVVEKILSENRQLVQLYSEILGLPKSASDSWKVNKIYLLIKMGVITMPQVMYDVRKGVSDDLL